MNCPRCGLLITKETGFCPECGASLLTIEYEKPAAPTSSAFSAAGDLGGTPAPAAPSESQRPTWDSTTAPSVDSTVYAPASHPQSSPPAAKPYVPRHASQESVAATPSVWDSVNASAAPTPKPAAPTGTVCPSCGAAGKPDSAFCERCGQRLQAAAPAPSAARPAVTAPRTERPVRSRPASAPAKTRNLMPFILGGVALIVVVALVIGILSLTGGPLVKIGSAAQKTVKSGNFTVDLSMDAGYDSAEATIYVDMDVKARELTLYAEVEGEQLGIYDGYFFFKYGEYGYAEDISDELDDAFEAYEASTDKDIGVLIEELNELMDDELEDFFDLDELEPCVTKFIKAANSESWLKKNAGLTTSKKDGATLYTFAPDFVKLMLATMPYFEKAFLDEDDYDDAMESLEDEDTGLEDVEMELTVGVKSGYLSTIGLYFDPGAGSDMEVSVEIYDVNKTKLDIDELEDILDDLT